MVAAEGSDLEGEVCSIAGEVVVFGEVEFGVVFMVAAGDVAWPMGEDIVLFCEISEVELTCDVGRGNEMML